jgi:excisionase family DNA binding protein
MGEPYGPDEEIGCRQAAEYAKVDPRTIATWIRRGWLPAFKLPGARGKYLIKFSDLQRVARTPYQSRRDDGQ